MAPPALPPCVATCAATKISCNLSELCVFYGTKFVQLPDTKWKFLEKLVVSLTIFCAQFVDSIEIDIGTTKDGQTGH